MSKHAAKIEEGIECIYIGLFRTRRDEGDDAYEEQLGFIINRFFEERQALRRFKEQPRSKAFEAALEAVSRIGLSLVDEKLDGFNEGVEAAFPNAKKPFDEIDGVFRGEHP